MAVHALTVSIFPTIALVSVLSPVLFVSPLLAVGVCRCLPLWSHLSEKGAFNQVEIPAVQPPQPCFTPDPSMRTLYQNKTCVNQEPNIHVNQSAFSCSPCYGLAHSPNVNTVWWVSHSVSSSCPWALSMEHWDHPLLPPMTPLAG